MDRADGRYVLLHHELSTSRHWDLMLECGEALATWQLHRRPEPGFREPIPASRIADHRIAYLTYEGSISGGRGRVRRLDAGTYRLLGRSDDAWLLEMDGSVLAGRFRLQREAPSTDTWRFEPEAGPETDGL